MAILINNQTPILQVNVGPLSDVMPVGSNGKFTKTNEIGEFVSAIWADYEISNRYEYHPNILMNGVTSPAPFQGASVSFVQIAAPTLLLVCDWTCARLAKMPIAPSTTCPDDWIFMWASPETAPVNVGPDAETPIYRISGVYVFGHKNPGDTVFANINFPRLPYILDEFTRRIGDNNTEENLIFSNTTNILRTPIR